MEHARRVRCIAWKTYSYPVLIKYRNIIPQLWRVFYSLVLSTICDTKYNFKLVDIGQYGSNNDNGVLANSTMGKEFSNGTMNIPPPSSLEGCSLDPFTFLLSRWPDFPIERVAYPRTLAKEQKIINRHLLRARRTIENSFRVLITREYFWHQSKTRLKML